MTISLYELSVPTFLQTTRALAHVLDIAARHCAAHGTDPDAFVTARLTDDMAPFHFQIESVRNHSVYGMEAVQTGVFACPPLVGAVPFAELQATLREAIAALEAIDRDAIDRQAGRHLDIELYRPVDPDHASTSTWGPETFAMTPELYLLSYALPNFYFHAVTAYHILRTRGVPVGKGDYTGVLRERAGGGANVSSTAPSALWSAE